MQQVYWLLALCTVAAVCPTAEARTFFADRAAMETSFGYLMDSFFDLAGTGVPGNYYDFGTFFLSAYQSRNDFATHPEFESSPFLYDGFLQVDSGNLESSGNTIISEGDVGDQPILQIWSHNGRDNISAFGIYIETGPLVTPASNEAVYAYIGGYNVASSGYTFSEGDFFGITGSVNAYALIGWDGVSKYESVAVSHMVAEPGYLTAGGDPHVIAHGLRSELDTSRPGDIFQMVAHPSVTINAAIRDFAFLPQTSDNRAYIGSIGMQMANGDQVYIEAYEEDEQAHFTVLLNGEELPFGTSVTHRGYDLHYTDFGAMPLSKKAESEFERLFPYHTQHGMVRLHMRSEIVIDVSLASQDVFVDWRHGQPEVYRRTGAFLNVNMRDLLRPTKTAGLLSAVGDAHALQQRLVSAVQEVEDLIAGKRPEQGLSKRAEQKQRQQERFLEEHSPAELAEILAHHRSALAAFDLAAAIETVVSQWAVEHIFA